MPVDLSYPRRIALLSHEDAFLEFIGEEEARRRISMGEVQLIWASHRVRAMRLVCADPYREHYPDSSGPRGLKYSHNAENDQNPEGCWTLSSVPRNKPFHEVLASVVFAPRCLPVVKRRKKGKP